jgi:hypothetical protein
MMKIHALAFGQWCGAREWTIPKQLLAEMLNVGDGQELDRAMPNVG